MEERIATRLEERARRLRMTQSEFVRRALDRMIEEWDREGTASDGQEDRVRG